LPPHAGGHEKVMTAKPKHRLRALIDTDVFVIDLRYPHDDRYEINRAFLEQVEQGQILGRTTIYNLLEVCGILSFNLSEQRLEELFIGFTEHFGVQVLFPPGEGTEVCFDPVSVLRLMKKKFAFGDALIAELAWLYRRRLDLLVTWNAVHFEGKLPLRVATPEQFLEGG